MQLAEVNVARLRAPIEEPSMAPFARALDDVNWLAERSPGFVWRYRVDGSPLAYGEVAGLGEVVVTLSVWDDSEALRQFIFRSAHALFMQRRGKWFVPLPGATTALWWVPAGDEPPLDDALSRLEHLRANGPSVRAFTLGRPFPPPAAPA